MLVNARIKRFVTCGNYPDKSALELFKEAGVLLERIEKPKMAISVLE